MTLGDRLRLAVRPPAEPGRVGTGLTFTDILFGFVISEIFVRLQNWSDLVWPVRWQLIATTALVLGSWIGFRRSLNRTTYEIKFFNLPLFRFILDQLMIILYFRMAVLTPRDARTSAASADALAEASAKTLLYIFVLYLIWDLLGLWMAVARQAGAPRYPRIENHEMTAQPAPRDYQGLLITAAFLAAVTLLPPVADLLDPELREAEATLAIAAALLLLYRFAKEIRTSWRLAAAGAISRR